MYDGIRDTQNKIAMEDIYIDFNFEDVIKSLALPRQQESMELLAARTLVKISKCKKFYKNCLGI